MEINGSDRYLNKYRIPSNRLRGWNYAQNGHYFITIVTKDRKEIFGKIVDGQMILNNIGEIVNAEFLKSFEMRNELYLGEYVIMPNHIHAILILDNDENDVAANDHIGTDDIGTGFKSSSINRIDDWIDNANNDGHANVYQKYNKNNPLWQANYHDHIIRNEMEYRRIAKYIVNNPLKWNEDTLSNVELNGKEE